MQTSRRKTGAGAWLLAVGAFLLCLAACAPHAPAASFAAAAAALRPGTLLWGYQGAFSAFTAAWSADGRALAIGEADGTVQVRDAVRGTLTLSLRGHTQQVWALAWSPDGRHLASAGSDGTVQVWNPATGQSPLTYRGHQATVAALAWSPDGRRLASAADDVRVWQAS